VPGLRLAAPGDLNGDGLDDVVIAVQGSVNLWHLQALTNFGQPDCNGNGQADYLDVLLGVAADCNGNGFLDVCEVLDPGADVNGNGVPDECELALESVSPDGGAWYSAHTLTLTGTFDLGAPLTVHVGASGPFPAQVLDANTAEVVLAASALDEVGSLSVAASQGGLQVSLPHAWIPTPALATGTTGSLAGGGRLQYFLRNELAGAAWFAFDLDLNSAAIPFPGIQHLFELQPASFVLLGTQAIAASPTGGAAPSFEVVYPAGIAPAAFDFRTQVLVVELDGPALFPAFTNTPTDTLD
jgi:hypothetical protein